MADYLTTDTELTSVANAIRTKGGTSAQLVYPAGFVSAIEGISTGTDVSDTTATAGDVLSGKYFYTAAGTKTQGSIATKTSTDLQVSGATVTAPAGYYSSAASKSVASGSATTPATTITANPSITVNSSGLITATASATQSVTPTVGAGYISSGTAGTITVSGSNTSQLTAQAAQTIHPSTTDQIIASGKYLTGTQTVKGVLLTNLDAGNIKKDVVVKVGDSTDDDCVTNVTGTYEGSGGGTYVEEKDVNFYDDLANNGEGGIVYSYTASEFANLTELPANPDHSNYSTHGISIPMTSDGWNWSLSDAKSYVAKYGMLDIGQMYVPSDGYTHYVCKTNSGRTEVYIPVSGTVDVKIDNGSISTLSGPFTLDLNDDEWHDVILIKNGANNFYPTSTTSVSSIDHQIQFVKEVYIGSNVTSLGNAAFACMFGLEVLTINKNVSSTVSYVLYKNYSLKHVTGSSSFLLSTDVSELYNLRTYKTRKSVYSIHRLAKSYQLRRYIIPEGCTMVASNLVGYCYSLTRICIPDDITIVSANAFAYAYGVKYFDFYKTTPPNLVNVSAFNNLKSDYVIRVPKGSLSNYTGANNWSSLATHIVERS